MAHLHALIAHHLKDFECVVNLLRLAARVDEARVRGSVGCHPLLLHLGEHKEGPLELLGLAACIDDSGVGGGVGFDAVGLHHTQHLPRGAGGGRYVSTGW